MTRPRRLHPSCLVNAHPSVSHRHPPAGRCLPHPRDHLTVMMHAAPSEPPCAAQPGAACCRRLPRTQIRHPPLLPACLCNPIPDPKPRLPLLRVQPRLHDDTTAILLRLEPEGSAKLSTYSPKPARRLNGINKLLGGKSPSEILTKPNSWHEEYMEGNLTVDTTTSPRQGHHPTVGTPPNPSVKAGILFRPFTHESRLAKALEGLDIESLHSEDSGSSSISETETHRWESSGPASPTRIP